MYFLYSSMISEKTIFYFHYDKCGWANIYELTCVLLEPSNDLTCLKSQWLGTFFRQVTTQDWLVTKSHLCCQLITTWWCVGSDGGGGCRSNLADLKVLWRFAGNVCQKQFQLPPPAKLCSLPIWGGDIESYYLVEMADRSCGRKVVSACQSGNTRHRRDVARLKKESYWDILAYGSSEAADGSQLARRNAASAVGDTKTWAWEAISEAICMALRKILVHHSVPQAGEAVCTINTMYSRGGTWEVMSL